MIRFLGIGALALLAAGAAGAQGGEAPLDDPVLVVAASNTTDNHLLVYDSTGTFLQAIPTQGQGGVSGNAGGIAYAHGRLAVVNFGSATVSVFAVGAGRAALELAQVIPASANPVSVAFGPDHLYVLTTTHVESHALEPSGISEHADGIAALVKADGSSAQVGVLDGRLIVSEKSNAIETVELDSRGAIVGPAALVADIPANVNAPFGLATRGDSAYVTIAHADEISLVRNGAVLTVTGSATQHAPCWVALDGPFLFSANSPSMSVSRYAVYGQKIVQDAAVAARFNGNPTDIAYRAGFAAVIDGNGTVSHVSVFRVDEDGNLTLRGVATVGDAATNGVAILPQEPVLGP
jgi:hypothetical protein